jgi:hypothetical protein
MGGVRRPSGIGEGPSDRVPRRELATLPDAPDAQSLGGDAPIPPVGAAGRRATIFDAPDRAAAQLLGDQFQTPWQTKAPRAVALLEAALDDVLAGLAYPAPWRTRLRTTNLGERLNQEIRRRKRVVRIFPHRAAAERLIGAVWMDHHEAWITDARYLDLTDFWADRQSPAAPETAAERSRRELAFTHRLRT